MEGIKTEPVDFVKEFQEYLSQQTQHVNMISGSVCGEKETCVEQHYPSHLQETQSPVEPSPPDLGLSLGEAAEVEGLERSSDGKYQCNYCSYSNKGMARLIEHIRIHTGEKPHRCQLCPFASAYERHLEAHMRAHTGEKPYKCDQCSYRCSDRSNLSHHRRRRHKLLPARLLQLKRQGALGFGRRLVSSFAPELRLRLLRDGGAADSGASVHGPMDPLSAPDSSETLRDEKPILIQEIRSHAKCSSSGQTSDCSPTPGLSRPASPISPALDQQGAQSCIHCQIQFTDNILYTIHMGCHGYELPFQCNVCGHLCRDKYDFACHFARGTHKEESV
ncbi:unnamed protein product [Knipowitschia caucasica]|uniref:Zinc finger protein Pegasus n=1 Tax=Knipowitschia caucasica TaxID=637954 RepID=A0AAV2LET2_KNICA